MKYWFNQLKRLTSALALVACLGVAAAAQDLSFTTPDGQAMTSAGMRGKVSVLAFSSIDDPQCRDLIKSLQSLAERYAGKDVIVYWVSLDPARVSNDRLRNPCGAVGSIVVLRDQSQAAFKRFGGRQLPTIVILDQQGQAQGRPLGGFNPDADFVNDLAGVIDPLLR